MTLEAVNVLPVPVAPRSTWNGLPALNPLTSWSMALGWSPAGEYGLASWNAAAMRRLRGGGRGRVVNCSRAAARRGMSDADARLDEGARGALPRLSHRLAVSHSHALNSGLLPATYYALIEQKSADEFEADILTLQIRGRRRTARRPGPGRARSGSPSTLPSGWWRRRRRPPAERPGRRLTVRHVSNHKVVAVVEFGVAGEYRQPPRLQDVRGEGRGAFWTPASTLLVIDPSRPPPLLPGRAARRDLEEGGEAEEGRDAVRGPGRPPTAGRVVLRVVVRP